MSNECCSVSTATVHSFQVDLPPTFHTELTAHATQAPPFILDVPKIRGKLGQNGENWIKGAWRRDTKMCLHTAIQEVISESIDDPFMVASMVAAVSYQSTVQGWSPNFNDAPHVTWLEMEVLLERLSDIVIDANTAALRKDELTMLGVKTHTPAAVSPGACIIPQYPTAPSPSMFTEEWLTKPVMGVNGPMMGSPIYKAGELVGVEFATT